MTQATPEIDLAAYPNVKAYLDRMRRPSVAAALATEVPLFRAEIARRMARSLLEPSSRRAFAALTISLSRGLGRTTICDEGANLWTYAVNPGKSRVRST